jgi:uncharacterized protein YcbX
MPRLARICIHPFKSLDPQPIDEAALLPSGALEHDRRFAIVDVGGDFVNGKRAPAIHRLRSGFDPASGRLTLRVEGTAEAADFDVFGQREPLAEWLSRFFQMRVTVIENNDGGFPDDTDSPGPTVVSTATLAEVGSWFGELPLEETRRRFRANLEIDAEEAFWEDRLVAGGMGSVRFAIGEVELLGTNPCARCVVPSRDSRSGDVIGGFAKSFARRRAETLAAWAPADRFDHFYRLAVNTRRADGRPATLRVGDELRILGEA